MTENELRNIIDNAWTNITSISSSDAEIVKAVNETIENLDSGLIRVAEKNNNEWIVNEWVKKAVLISFRINDNKVLKGPYTSWFDKVEGKQLIGLRKIGIVPVIDMFLMAL
tara:strand:+ start:98 stop:430 length:333 start_codon:yes stop_codon:yes gene_type:complete